MMYNYQKVFQRLPQSIQEYIGKDKDLQQHIQKHKLDEEEVVVLVEDEMGLYVSGENQEQQKEKLIQAAKNTLQHLQAKQQITIRLAKQDLIKVKSKAQQQGIPYQTLISSAVHKYILS